MNQIRYASDNDADGKKCIAESWTDKDYKYPDSYQPGPGGKGSSGGSDKKDNDKDEGY